MTYDEVLGEVCERASRALAFVCAGVSATGDHQDVRSLALEDNLRLRTGRDMELSELGRKVGAAQGPRAERLQSLWRTYLLMCPTDELRRVTAAHTYSTLDRDTCAADVRWWRERDGNGE